MQLAWGCGMSQRRLVLSQAPMELYHQQLHCISVLIFFCQRRMRSWIIQESACWMMHVNKTLISIIWRVWSDLSMDKHQVSLILGAAESQIDPIACYGSPSSTIVSIFWRVIYDQAHIILGMRTDIVASFNVFLIYAVLLKVIFSMILPLGRTSFRYRCTWSQSYANISNSFVRPFRHRCLPACRLHLLNFDHDLT